MEHQDYDMNEYGTWEQERPKSRIGLGILIGSLSTMLILGLIVAGICKAFNLQIVLADRGAGKNVVTQSGQSVLNQDSITKINELSAYTKLYFYDEIDVEEVQNAMYEGMIKGLGDKYSVYYNEQDYMDFQVSASGQYYGIGAGLSQDMKTMIVTITKVYEGTPSEAAGLKKDDIIVSVDGIDGTSMEVSDLVQHIRGEKGTTVQIEVYRSSTEEYLTFEVERADITLPSVEHQMMEGNIGYIRIDSFEADTAHQFKMAVLELAEQDLKGLILDLRYNSGGYISSVAEIADDILPEGMIVYTEDKAGMREEYKSTGETYINLPIVVLINGESASAAEILAGAIKDHNYGTLIGTTTFGKGIVQTLFPLSNGDALKLTTAKYFTPSGNYIHEVGIAPDIELEYEYLNPDGEEYEEQYDNQIQKAIEVLKEQIAE